jgi:hypothetical protein
MFSHKLKVIFCVLVFLATGAAVAAYQGSRGPADEKVAAPRPQDVAAPVRASEFAGPISEWPMLLGHHPGNQAILNALDKPIPIKFATETPLSDVIKSIRDSTVDKAAGLPAGIPIYVDPQGLQDSDKTLDSTVTLDLEGIALKTTLRLLLNQLSLTYWVRDGLLTITSTQTDDDPSPLARLVEMARRGELTKEQYKELIETLKLRLEVVKLNKEFEKLEYHDSLIGAIGAATPILFPSRRFVPGRHF